MVTIADIGREPAEQDLPADSPTPALVYLVVGIGLAISLLGLLFARGEFALTTVLLALLATLPYLLFSRLALARPGAEAVVAGVVLLAVGAWGSIDAIDDGDANAFVQLPFALVAVEAAVFGIGALLRRAVPARGR